MDNSQTYALFYEISQAYCQRFAPDDLAILEMNKSNLKELIKWDVDKQSNAMGSGLTELLPVELVLIILGFLATQVAAPVTVEVLKLKLHEWYNDKAEIKNVGRKVQVSETVLTITINNLIEIIQVNERKN